MIILDTAVISETQKRTPDPAVMEWLDAQDPTNLYLTTITTAELMLGASSGLDPARSGDLVAIVDALINDVFAGRVLPFDESAARVYAERVAAAQKRGYRVSIADGQVAAISLSRPGALIATNNTSPFLAMGARPVDPWALGGLGKR